MMEPKLPIDLHPTISEKPRICFYVERDLMDRFGMLIPWGARTKVMNQLTRIVLDLFEKVGQGAALDLLGDPDVMIGVAKRKEQEDKEK